MSHPQNNQLDHMLSNWANETAASPEDLESLKSDICGRLREGAGDAVQLEPRQEPRRLWATGAFAAAAATVLLIVLADTGQERPGPEVADNARRPIAFDTHGNLEPIAIERCTRLLHEYQAVFGGELAWIVEQDDAAQVGLIDSRTAPSTSTNCFLAIRLALWSRPAGGGPWKEVQSIEVLTEQEETVRVYAGDGNPAQLEIWAYPLDAKLVSIDLRYQPSVPDLLHIDESVLQRVGEHSRVCRFEKDGVEYHLYQIADLLHDDDLG